MTAKSALDSATLLNHPDPNSETWLSTDASDSAIGAELSQKHHVYGDQLRSFPESCH